MLKKGKLIPLIFSGVTAAAVSLATVSCSFEQNPLTVEGPYEYMVETGGKIQPETDYDPYKVELHEAQVKTGVTMSINPISYIGDEVWDYIAINEEGYLYTKDGFTADEPRTLTFTVHAEYKDAKANKNYECDSAIVSIAIVEPSGKQAVIDGGESYIPLKYGVSHETAPFTMLVNDELQSGVTFTKEKINPTDPDIPDQIDIDDSEAAGYTEAKITVAADTPVGTYTFKIQGAITPDGDDDIVASTNVTVVVSENEYTLVGGSTSLELYTGATGSEADAKAWTLFKDGTDITNSVKFSFVEDVSSWLNIGAGGTSGHTKNVVYWEEVPYSIDVPKKVTLQATTTSNEVLATLEIPISIKEAVYSVQVVGDDVIVDQTHSGNYECFVQTDAEIENYDVEWKVTSILGEDMATIDVDGTTGKANVTTVPYNEEEEGMDFSVRVWPEISILLPGGTEPTVFNKDGEIGLEQVDVVSPYQADGATETYCWGDLDDSGEEAWFELDETDATTFGFKKVGAEGTAKEVSKSTFNSPIYFGKERKVVDTNKFNGSTVFNSDITFPSQPFAIGDDFLFGCTAYDVTTPTMKFWSNYGNCTNIGNSFMYGCTAVQAMTIPDTVISIGLDFMVNCNSLKKLGVLCPLSVFNQDSDMTLTVASKTCAAATNGIEIIDSESASIVSEFESMFPEISVPSTGELPYYRVYYRG